MMLLALVAQGVVAGVMQMIKGHNSMIGKDFMVSQKLVAQGLTFGCFLTVIVYMCCIFDVWVIDAVCYHLAVRIILKYRGSGKKSLIKSSRENEVDDIII